MKDFEYAAPTTEEEVVDLLGDRWGQTEVLAGGTDLVGLMKQMIVSPERVVNIKEVPSMHGIERDSDRVLIGATTTLDEMLDAAEMADYPSILQIIRNISSIQLQSQGTLGGELCQRPRCWYFRNGHGLLAAGGKRIEEGRNRYHAILGNSGAAKFVHPSRLAPALIAMGAELRLLGPKSREEQILPLADFYRVARTDHQREHVLKPNQIITHVILPPADRQTGAYEVRHGAGPDYPLAAAAASLRISGGVVQDARVVMGHVAPIPWNAPQAAGLLVGQTVTPEVAESVGEAAVSQARPLSENEYKIQLAKVAVKRAVLLAAGLETGGF